MKAVLSNRIYINTTKELSTVFEKELIYSICQMPTSEFPLIINNITRVGDKVSTIPSGRVDLIPEEYQIIDKRVTPKAHIPEPKFTPRPNQQEAIDTMEEGLINAKPGWGKTIAALGIAHRLQTKTLIVCTTTLIRDMWIKEVKKWFGFEPGVIGSGKFKTDPPIVVANIQTLRNHVDKFSREFGLIVVDEVHRAAAATFTRTLNTFHAKHKLGLSGTLERRDGLHCVLPDYFGNKKFVAIDENRLVPEVHLYDFDIILNNNEFIPWAHQVRKLIDTPIYTPSVINLANLYVDAGHRILGLCTLTEPLEDWHMLTEDKSALVIGSIKIDREEVFKEICKKDTPLRIIWGTQSIFAEGVSINSLSAVILGAPMNNMPLLEQIAGRIQRHHTYEDGTEKTMPVVIIDIGLSGGTGRNQRNSRMKFYIEQGWRIKNMGKIS